MDNNRSAHLPYGISRVSTNIVSENITMFPYVNILKDYRVNPTECYKGMEFAYSCH